MKPSEFLAQALSLIDTPEKWTRNAYGRDANGLSLPPSHEGSVCFCTMGAVHMTETKTGQPTTADKAQGYLDQYAKAQGARGVFSFNDRSTHDDVVRMFRICIGRAKAAYE